jgi:DNA polymerase-3 subunit alpha
MGIRLLPPDVNKSDADFTVEGKDLRFGLVAIKNIGWGFIHQLMEHRKNDGPFRSFDDFCTRMCGRELNKRAVENLIKCGACDCFGLHRSQLLAIYEAVMDSVVDSRRRNVEGQMGLFDLGGEEEQTAAQVAVPKMPELSRFGGMIIYMLFYDIGQHN